jgi:hypothetical protein
VALVYGQDERVLGWMGRGMHDELRPTAHTIGWESGGELRAAFSFEWASRTNVFVHLVSTGAVPRRLIHAACVYAFGQCGARRATFLVDDENAECMDLMDHLELRMEGCMRDGHADGNTYIFALFPWHPFVQRLFCKGAPA